ncbi:methyltransferase-like protein 5-like [Planoprotostelium fungivorum]|uniref:Methyltransferase-like protein 5-like n=1 Tax=Planoprotostelium fungivorum TaxID=1890364 RepID=A0A2P6N9K6_9EUKA|nr:methyltransferase-like protein 5-like [Planoprotostelium fungivorum]
MKMRLRELESILQKVKPFEKPNVELEQYPTSPHLAAQCLFAIQEIFGDIEDKNVLDLGCGPAILSIGACVLGASNVFGVDLDESALEIARENCEEIEADVELFHHDVNTLTREILLQKIEERRAQNDEASEEEETNEETNEEKDDGEDEEDETDDGPIEHIDTVIMNPPFGTRKQGADMMFVQKALTIAKTAVYSLHKTSTREYILKKCEEWGVQAEVVAQLRWDIPKMYKFHKQKSADIQVDLIRIQTNHHEKKLGSHLVIVCSLVSVVLDQNEEGTRSRFHKVNKAKALMRRRCQTLSKTRGTASLSRAGRLTASLRVTEFS